MVIGDGGRSRTNRVSEFGRVLVATSLLFSHLTRHLVGGAVLHRHRQGARLASNGGCVDTGRVPPALVDFPYQPHSLPLARRRRLTGRLVVVPRRRRRRLQFDFLLLFYFLEICFRA